MSKHILFIAPSAYPLGGVAVWLDYLVPGLEEKGWKVALGLVSGRHHNVQAYRKVYPGLKNIIQISNATGSREGRTNSLVKAINLHNPDLVICVNIPDVYEAINRIRQKKLHAPRIAMAIHGFQPDLLGDMSDYRNVLDAVICTNKLTMRLAHEEARIDMSRCYYAPYGVNLVQAGPEKHAPVKKIKIAWVGRLEQFQKHIWDIPGIIRELVASNVCFELRIAGSGPDECAFVEKLEQDGLSKYVNFLGVIPPEEMQGRVYDACDVLLVTSYWETGPIIIWEAMASGIPVVSSRYIGSGLEAGLVDGENCLLFDIGDSKAAVVQLQLLQDSEIISRLVAGGYELVNKRYTKKISVKKWNEVLQAIFLLPIRKVALQKKITKSGRLDQIFGVRVGEVIRNILGVYYLHESAGGEWPHTNSSLLHDDTSFWEKAKDEDVGMSNK